MMRITAPVDLSLSVATPLPRAQLITWRAKSESDNERNEECPLPGGMMANSGGEGARESRGT